MNSNKLDSPNDYLKELINLSSKSDVNVFSKKNKKWIMKDTRTILNECTKRKQKEIKNTLSVLNNLAKYCKNTSLTEIKKVNTTLEDKIYNIDLIINHINDNSSEDYIECYSNNIK
jgi:hypothetical protein